MHTTLLVNQPLLETMQTLQLRAQRTLLTLALSDKMTERHKDQSREEKVRRMTELIEAIRAESIANGTAIDNDDEAALDD